MARADYQQPAYPGPLLALLTLTSHLLTHYVTHVNALLTRVPTHPPLLLLATNILDISLKLPLFLILTLPGIIYEVLHDSFNLFLLFTIDFGLSIGNYIFPPIRGVPKGHPSQGAPGKYAPAKQPGPQDSRSPCPALNALANHGILPNNGKKIPLEELGRAIRTTFNTSETFTGFAVEALRKQFGRDWINLSDLGAHGLIEHDASLLRHDTFHQPYFAAPAPDLINALTSPIGRPIPDKLTIYDIARFSALRRAQTLATNPQAEKELTAKHALFGSNNAALLLVIWDGDVKAIKRFLETETFEDGWITAARGHFGATFLEFNLISLRLELSTQLDKILLPSQLTNLSNPKFEEIKWGNITADKAVARGVEVFGVVSKA